MALGADHGLALGADRSLTFGADHNPRLCPSAWGRAKRRIVIRRERGWQVVLRG
jgi:hypothetical protein